MSVEGPLISNHQHIVIEEALQGLGILYTYDYDGVDEAIARGQLKPVLTDWTLMSPGLFLYYSNRRHPQPALRAFIDCMLTATSPRLSDRSESSARKKWST
jgi:DNA-binding transcriptional LysR family regulator